MHDARDDARDDESGRAGTDGQRPPPADCTPEDTQPERALPARLLAVLADGRHPLTGAALPDDAPTREPLLVAALRAGVEALRAHERQQARRARLPPNVGKSWSGTDDARLLAAYDAGAPLDAIAAELGRTRTGVRSRLERHGRLAPPLPATAA